jgi:hypothetical protein
MTIIHPVDTSDYIHHLAQLTMRGIRPDDSAAQGAAGRA